MNKLATKLVAMYNEAMAKKQSFRSKAMNKRAEEDDGYYTVWLWPGAGYTLNGFATQANGEEAALYQVAQYLGDNGLHGYYQTTDEHFDFYKEQYPDLSDEEISEKEFTDESATYIDTSEGFIGWVTTENMNIEKGINEKFIDQITIIDGPRKTSSKNTKLTKKAGWKVLTPKDLTEELKDEFLKDSIKEYVGNVKEEDFYFVKGINEKEDDQFSYEWEEGMFGEWRKNAKGEKWYSLSDYANWDYIYLIKEDKLYTMPNRESLTDFGVVSSKTKSLSKKAGNKEQIAEEYVKKYYRHEMDLEDLHSVLYKLFGTYKEAVTWLAENDERIKMSAKKIKLLSKRAGSKEEIINKAREFLNKRKDIDSFIFDEDTLKVNVRILDSKMGYEKTGYLPIEKVLTDFEKIKKRIGADGKARKTANKTTKQAEGKKYYAVAESGTNFGSNDNKEDLKEEIRDFVVAHKDNFEKKEKIYLKESDTDKTIEEIIVRDILTPYGSKKWVIVATKKQADKEYPQYLVEVGKKGYGLVYDESAIHEFEDEKEAREFYYALKKKIKPNQYVVMTRYIDSWGDGAYEEVLNSELDDDIDVSSQKTTKQATIKHENGVYNVYSESGKCLGKGYKTKEEAEKRLKQVEYFKHKKASIEYDIEKVQEYKKQLYQKYRTLKTEDEKKAYIDYVVSETENYDKDINYKKAVEWLKKVDSSDIFGKQATKRTTLRDVVQKAATIQK